MNRLSCLAIAVLITSSTLFAQEQKPTTASGKATSKPKPKIVKYPDAKVWNDAATAAKEFPQSEWIGEYVKDERAIQVTCAAGKFYVSTYQGGLPGDGWDGNAITHQWAALPELKKIIDGWTKVDRSVAVVGKKPPANAIVLFDGTNTAAWKNGKLEDGLLKAGCRTKKTFTDFKLYLEFLVPLKPEPPIGHPHRGNSGVFALGAYEVQIADTFGLDLNPHAWRSEPLLKPVTTWCGSIYGHQAPKLNMCLPPLTWQSMEIEFKSARFEDGKKVSPAIISVIQNGVQIHDQFELPGGTGGGPAGPRDEVGSGPITIQRHGNPNLFRNIWVVKSARH